MKKVSTSKFSDSILPNALCIVSIILLASIFFASRDVPAEINRAEKYKPIKISDNTPVKPGAFAWAPDNRKIAFIGDQINIYDTVSKKLKNIDIKAPLYVSWPREDELLVIYKQGDRKVLCSVNTENLTITGINIGQDADAVYRTTDSTKLLLLSYKTESLKIGIEMQFTLFLYDRNDGSQKTIYTFSRIYPRKNFDIKTATAWIYAGPSPLDDSFLIMEHIKPPVLSPYSKIRLLDPATGKTRTFSDVIIRKKYISGSWSPDGRRMALTDGERHLEITDMDGTSIPEDESLLGIYPSWNHKGSQIFIGGYIVDSDGKNKEEILPNSVDSISQWSPDGTKIAVATRGELWLFEDFRPRFISGDRPFDKMLSEKILLLRELLHEGLITGEEYEERAGRILKGPVANQ